MSELPGAVEAAPSFVDPGDLEAQGPWLVSAGTKPASCPLLGIIVPECDVCRAWDQGREGAGVLVDALGLGRNHDWRQFINLTNIIYQIPL